MSFASYRKWVKAAVASGLVLSAFASGLMLSAFAAMSQLHERVAPPAAERIALVIGNGAYEHHPDLANATNDAADMASVLADRGFSVLHLYNVGFDAIRQGLRQFSEEAARSEIAVVFYAGRSTEVDKCLYLLPVDILPEESLIKSHHMLRLEAIPLDRVMGSMQGASRFRLAILDASRVDIFSRRMRDRVLESREFPSQVCRAEPQGETLVAYSTQEGNVAHDGDGKGRNSPYTQALLHYLKYPDLDIGLVFRLVRDAVMVSTGGRQVPVVYGSSGQGVYLSGLPDPFQVFEVEQAGDLDLGPVTGQ